MTLRLAQVVNLLFIQSPTSYLVSRRRISTTIMKSGLLGKYYLILVTSQ